MRLIDADALKEKAFGKRGGLIHTSDIDEMPTAQPHDYSDGFVDGYKNGVKDTQPERTGKWMEWMEWMEVSYYGAPPTYVYSCSECHLKSFGMHNYCPNCGAKMEGETNDS